MNLGDIKNHVYRRTKTNSSSFPAADMLISVNNGIERVETKIREFVHGYNFTRFTSGDLSTGTAEPKFYSLFHELVPLWIEYQYAVDNSFQNANLFLQEIQLKEAEMERWYGLRQYKVCSITIASPGVVTIDNHGLQTNDRVIFETSGALPTGLSAETWYYVIYLTEHTFEVSATRDGTAITTSGSQTGTHFVGRDVQMGFRLNVENNR